MDTNETGLLKRLTTAFNALRSAGIVHTQKDFAALLDYSEPAISQALKGSGRYLSEKLVARAERAVALQVGTHPAATEQDIVIPAATAKMYADMAESIRILSELVAAQQKGGAAATAITPAANG